jgi:transposase
MDFLPGQDRFQVTFGSLEEKISDDNPVRFLDAFVDKLELDKLGFKVNTLKTEGRPAFNPKLYMKIYMYGYLNGVRSSRKLERECSRNIELQWLTKNLQPNYHNIADFRKLNSAGLKNVFKLFVRFLKEADLVGGKMVAVDGTKIRASNSKKNNYSEKKIARHLKYIEEQTNNYLKQLDENDRQEEPLKLKDIEEKLERLKTNKIKYESLDKALKESDETQISTTDEDSRLLQGQGLEFNVGYNVQASVDDKFSLVVGTQAINETDRNALSAIAIETKENVGVDTLTALADKGYHTGEEILKCGKENITTIVSKREIANSKGKGTTPEYLVDKFIYNKEADNYTCPQGNILITDGEWKEYDKEGKPYKYKSYKTKACKNCPVKHLCTSAKFREIHRKNYTEAVEENDKRYLENLALYKKRQELNEHIFGTIKRQWGYNYTNLRGLEKVEGEFNLIMTVYNIRRVITILGIKQMIEMLDKWIPKYAKMIKNALNQVQLSFIKLFLLNKMQLAN